MELEKLYNGVLEYYPGQIDISDGNFVSETNGFNSVNLFSSYEAAEEAVSLAGEWHSLINWVIYQVLHEIAINQFVKDKSINRKALNKNRVRDLLIENLKTDGYEDMYLEFIEYEKVYGLFK